MTLPPTLSRYIAGQFLMWFGATFALLLALMFLGDLVELLRRAAGLQSVTFDALLEMTALKIPYNAQEIMPFGVLFGSILGLWRMTKNQELVVARAAGVSVWQFLTPVFGLAFLVGVIGVTLFNPVASTLQETYVQMDERVLRSQANITAISGSGLWLRQADGDIQTVIHGVRLPGPTMALKNVMVLVFDAQDRLIRRIDADSAELGDGQWHLLSAWNWEPSLAAAQPTPELELPTNLTPRKIEESFASPETLSFWALPPFIRLLEQSGFSAQRHLLYFNSLLARPFLLCGMVLVAAVFSLRMQRRGGTTGLIVAGVSAGFVLYFLTDVAFALGNSATIPVVLAAWTPAGISMLLGVTFLLHLEDG